MQTTDTTATEDADLTCNFCGKSRHSVRKIIRASTGAVICGECIAQSVEILLNEENGTKKPIKDPADVTDGRP